MKPYSILLIARPRPAEPTLLPALLEQYEVLITHTRKEAMSYVAHQSFDLVLLDIATIRFDAARFCADLQRLAPALPIIVLLDKETSLDTLPPIAGYLRYPLTARQLLRQISHTLNQEEHSLVEWQGLRLDVDNHFLIWGSQVLPLTPKQTALTLAFLSAPEETLSQARLFQEVWGTDYAGYTRSLAVHIHWLRESLKSLQAPFAVKTRRGEGYRLTALNAPPAP